MQCYEEIISFESHCFKTRPLVEKYNSFPEVCSRIEKRGKEGIDGVRRQARRVVTLSCLDRG